MGASPEAAANPFFRRPSGADGSPQTKGGATIPVVPPLYFHYFFASSLTYGFTFVRNSIRSGVPARLKASRNQPSR